MRIQKDLARIQDVITVMDDEVGGGVNGLDLVNNNMQRIFSIQVDSDGVDGQSDLARVGGCLPHAASDDNRD